MEDSLGIQRLALLKRPVPTLDYAEAQVETVKKALLGEDLERAEYALREAQSLAAVARAILVHRRERVQ